MRCEERGVQSGIVDLLGSDLGSWKCELAMFGVTYSYFTVITHNFIGSSVVHYIHCMKFYHAWV